jgi:hypothetical protein
MTRFLDDIFRQPSSLLSALDYLTGAERPLPESIANLGGGHNWDLKV